MICRCRWVDSTASVFDIKPNIQIIGENLKLDYLWIFYKDFEKKMDEILLSIGKTNEIYEYLGLNFKVLSRIILLRLVIIVVKFS